MIVYSATKKRFLQDVLDNNIAEKVLEKFIKTLGHSTAKNEIQSWQNSAQFMYKILEDPEIPDESSIALEYQIALTSRRIDFIIAGTDACDVETVVIIELKQWQTAKITPLDGIVETFVGGKSREVAHPSYQAWSYAALIEDFNETVQDDKISLKPCAYLHNYTPDDVITNYFYHEYTDKAPIFLRTDAIKLRNFIKKFIKNKDNTAILTRIDKGKLHPSKNLADKLDSLLQGNKEFIMIDDQKLVYETCMKLARESTPENKNVLIIEGGPGTGKSVVAINLLVDITKLEKVAQYVTRNSAPRLVYESKLTGTFKKSQITKLFSSSGSYHDVENNIYDVLIIDEAHRLNEKSGMFQNIGENQVKELIEASKLSIFFVDEDQRVTLQDIGNNEEIKKWASKAGATVHNFELISQFRCNGSDGYLAWLDNILQIRETANFNFHDFNYEFRVLSSPTDLHELIYEKNKINNKARMVAGYCWKWQSKKDPMLYDIIFPQYNYSAKWNLDTDGMLWIVKPGSVNEIGCIHTCQGLEVDYIGVIIGPDLVVRDGKVITDATKRAGSDRSVHGYKKLHKENPVKAEALGDIIVKNTYRTLMTRGHKACYVFSNDPETQEYIEELVA